MLAEYIKLSCKELTENGYDVILIVTYNQSLSIDRVKLFLKNIKVSLYYY